MHILLLPFARFRNLNNIGKFSLFLILGVVLTFVGFSSDSYASTDYYSGTLQLNASICYSVSNGNGGQYYYCNGEREVVLQPLTSNNTSIGYQLYYDTDTDNSVFNYLSQDYDDSSCGSSRQCFLKITKAIYVPRVSSSDSSQPVQGEYFSFQLTSNKEFYFGTWQQFFSYSVSTMNTFGGFDSYINYNTGSQYSCLDSLDGNCAMRYYFFTHPVNLTDEGIYHSTVTRGLVEPEYLSNILVVNNPYDTDSEIYNRSAYVSLLFFQPINKSSNWIEFFVKFNTDTSPLGFDDNSGINPDTVSEWNYQEDKLSNTSQLGNISIPISNPFYSWLVLFTDNQCISISTIPSWFGLSTQYLCSPWSSSIRNVITPIISVAGIMLIFGFVVSYLSGHSNLGKIDKGDIWYG